MKISLLWLLVVLSGTVNAQPVAIAFPPPANPCNSLGATPTFANCWDCFQVLLGDCDKGNTVERRKACYEGANNFFTWCLGRTTTPPGGGRPPAGPPVSPRPHTTDMKIGEGFSFDINFNSNVPVEDIEVYVRDTDNKEARSQKVTTFIAGTEGDFNIFFDTTNLGIADDTSVGVVIVLKNKKGEVYFARADAYAVVNPLDLDKNGVVDAQDLAEAMNQYSQQTMTFNDFINFQNAYFGKTAD